MQGSLLVQTFVYLAAAVVMVPVAKRLGLGSVLGYLIAGVAIGPYVLGLVGHEGAEVKHVAEFGVVMMLFLVGLELKPAVLWQLRRPILGLGGTQVALTATAAATAAIGFGQPWREALALGLVVAGSSTAIVVQSLGEKGLLKSEGGQATFAVLLFQDIAVIPMLAAMPVLGAGDAAAHAAAEATARPGWLTALLVLVAVAAIVLAGRFLVRPLFRLLAETRLREVFTSASLALVVGVTLLMERVGLSPALGAFVAGVVLAENEYRHELESDIEPFVHLGLADGVGAITAWHLARVLPHLPIVAYTKNATGASAEPARLLRLGCSVVLTDRLVQRGPQLLRLLFNVAHAQSAATEEIDACRWPVPLPDNTVQSSQFEVEEFLPRISDSLIRAALRQGSSLRRAAALLSIPESTLRLRMRMRGIFSQSLRPEPRETPAQQTGAVRRTSPGT